MKPRMFKIGGAWTWICEHPTGSQVGDVFHEGDWRHPWDSCLGTVIKHALMYHGNDELVETIELS